MEKKVIIKKVTKLIPKGKSHWISSPKKYRKVKEKKKEKNSSHVVKAFFKLQYRLTCIHHNQSFNSRCIPTHDHEEERQRQFDGGSDPNIMGVENYI